jgi:uncharacterized protein YecE (DUF72 family)
MAENVYIGTSGFSYDDWKEVFYPAKMSRKDFLEYYSKFFPAIEVNFTYYQMPFERTINALIRKSVGRLKFIVKAHQSLTHERIEQEEPYQQFQAALRPLEEAGVLSGVLAQFPFSFKRNIQNLNFLERFHERMNMYPLIIEFRHASWVNQEMMAFLKERNSGFCCVDEPKLPGLVPKVLINTNNIGYIRFHGRNKETWWNYKDQSERYDYLYHRRELGDWARRLKEFAENVNELFVFFNNHPRGQAVKNAFMMKQYFGETIDYTQHPLLFKEELEQREKSEQSQTPEPEDEQVELEELKEQSDVEEEDPEMHEED